MQRREELVRCKAAHHRQNHTFFKKIQKNCKNLLTRLPYLSIISHVAGASVGRQRMMTGCSAVLVARLNGVQEAVSSTLATRTKDGCQKQQKPSPHGLGFFCWLYIVNASVGGRTCTARSAKAITCQRVTAANLRAIYMRSLQRSKKQKAAYLKRDKRLLAGVEGFEPSARGFGDRCSTN